MVGYGRSVPMDGQGGFALSGTLLGCGLHLLWRGPRCWGGGGAVIGRGGRAGCTRLDDEGRAVYGPRGVGLG